MCYKIVDAFLPALKFGPDWCVTSKMIKKLYDDLFSNGDIILFNEDSNYVKLLVMKWVFLIVLILTMLILIKMILKLLFMCTIIILWLGAINLNNVKHLKKNKQRINPFSMASNKIVGLVFAR